MHDARVVPSPSPQEALAWLSRQPAGALAFVVTTAKGAGLHATPSEDAPARLEAACARALEAGAARALAWHAEGEVPAGSAVAVVGACAEHREDALRAVDLLLAGLKGVARRRDL